ncbi:MAG: hypothetical protein LC637_09655 [Xanthomonadaceae bacterium]|nr:hypothetical protein [Xanthomonadaceae bacterium]
MLAVLNNAADQPLDLRRRSAMLAGAALELGQLAAPGEGDTLALATLETGAALKKFEAICEAQGGMRTPPTASAREVVTAERAGSVWRFDNRRLAKVAKLAGAPAAAAAGIELHVHLEDRVEVGQPLYTIHAESRGELSYAHEFSGNNGDIIEVRDSP